MLLINKNQSVLYLLYIIHIDFINANPPKHMSWFSDFQIRRSVACHGGSFWIQHMCQVQQLLVQVRRPPELVDITSWWLLVFTTSRNNGIKAILTTSDTITYYYILLHTITYYYILLHTITYYYILLHTITYYYKLLQYKYTMHGYTIGITTISWYETLQIMGL